jgi:CheY-like chemotaxis protein
MSDKAILVVDDNVEFAVLLGTLISEQGLTPILAHSAEIALGLAKQYKPTAVVLDLLLPDMTGHKLLAQLSRVGPLPPVFVITGVFKGQAQMDKVRGIAKVEAWHEKPFDTRVLVEQIVNAVSAQPARLREEHKRVGVITGDFDINILDPVEVDGIISADVAAEPADDPSDEIEVEVDETALAMWDVVGQATPAQNELKRDDGLVIDDLLLNSTEKFSQLPDPEERPPKRPPAPLRSQSQPKPQAPAPQRVPPPRPQSAPKPAPPPQHPKSTDDSFGGQGTDPFKHEHSPTPHEVKTGLRAKMRSGPLKPATVPRLLTAFYISQETGEIVFERKNERKVVYFQEGRPVYARSNAPEDRFGAFAKRAYRLSDAQIERALEVARSSDRMLGEVLIAEGAIAASHKEELLREQTRAIIKSVLTWTEGRYVIGFNAQAAIERAELSEHPAALVLSSMRELFGIDRLRVLAPDRMQPMPSPAPPYELSEIPMSDAEAMLVLRSTGARTLNALIKEMANRIDEKSARAFVYGLMTLGVLVAGRSMPPKDTALVRN